MIITFFLFSIIADYSLGTVIFLEQEAVLHLNICCLLKQ